jgi:predicted ATPase
MRLTNIEIVNFKGVASRQPIELKPITLLFGPNSAGKSTILQALHYLREILERQNIDPDLTIAGGLIDLGGFATLVHNHELDRVIRIKVTLSLSDEQGLDALPLNMGLSAGEAEFQELQLRYLLGESAEVHDYAVVQQVALDVEISWSELERAPYVSRLGVDLDDRPFAAIVSPPQIGRAQLTDFNFAHPLLLPIVSPDEETSEDSNSNAPSSPLEDELWSLAREAALDRSTADTPDDQIRIAVVTNKGALPDIDRELDLDLRDPDSKKAELELQTSRVIGLRRLLSEMFLGPVRLVRDYLCATTYIGPLREIPGRSYRPQVSPDEARWANGLAAWDLLYTDRKTDLMEEVNDWLSGENKLHTGYRLERLDFKEVPVPSLFHQIFERGVTEDDIGELQELYTSLHARSEIALRDFDKGIIVAPSDVGVGISQMVPVVVSALRSKEGLLAIEQPELHVHPAIQVAIGDLLIRAVRSAPEAVHSGKAVLIETHSEHIMLRLLRRIRETAEQELPPGVTGLTLDDLAVIYVEGSDSGVRFRKLRVDQTGEFLDRWPRGFFEERGEELF